MPASRSKPIEDAEYYALRQDGRIEARSLGDRANQYNCDPQTKDEWLRRNEELWKSLDENWKPGLDLPKQMVKVCGVNPDFHFPKNLMPKFSCFKKPAPANLRHREELTIYGYYPLLAGAEGGAQLVSSDWRDAIEMEDPGSHDFYPHELRFLNKTVEYFVFRHRVGCTPTCFDLSDARTEKRSDGSLRQFMNDPPRYITISRSKIRSVAFQLAVDCSTPYPIVARRLAKRLAPLLPRILKLMPLQLAD